MKTLTRLLALTFVAFSISCAGGDGLLQWDHCDPGVCSGDCDFDENNPSAHSACITNLATVSVAPGSSTTVRAYLAAEGPLEGKYNITVTPQNIDGITATVAPMSGGASEGSLLEVTVTVTADASAVVDEGSIQIEASNGEDMASTNFSIEIP